MESKWSQFCSFSLSFPNYSWADAEDSDLESDTSESESEVTIMEYHEVCKNSLSSEDTGNDETVISDKSDHESIATNEDDHPDMSSEWAQEERNCAQAVLYKRFSERTPLSQLVLHKATVIHALKVKCFFSDWELGNLSDAKNEIWWCIMSYS